MLDGIHSGTHRGGNAIAADGVRRHFLPQPMRFLHNRLRFLIREVHHAVEHAVGLKMVAAVRVILDPIRAIHCLLAHGLARPVHTVDILHARGHFQLPRVAQ